MVLLRSTESNVMTLTTDQLAEIDQTCRRAPRIEPGQDSRTAEPRTIRTRLEGRTHRLRVGPFQPAKSPEPNHPPHRTGLMAHRRDEANCQNGRNLTRENDAYEPTCQNGRSSTP